MDNTAKYLYRLSQLEGFKIHMSSENNLIIEAAGIKYDCSGRYNFEETMEEAYLMIASHMRAREIVMNAKVTIL